ncbi:MAG: glycoside hydrolase family 16 protein [Chloroflexi bacterium]|nr:glycoside hydrolase family 16 protein [Chloroflexota bacterium]
MKHVKHTHLIAGACSMAFAAVVCLSWSGHAAPPAASRVLLPLDAAGMSRLAPSSAQVKAALSADPAAPGVVVTIQPGSETYPGLSVKPAAGSWNLSAYGHIDVRLVNTGGQPITIALRVDNAGDWHDNPWNAESIGLKPGEAGTAEVIFGYSYGHKPGYHLKPGAIVNILLFASRRDSVQSFRLESLTAGGPAGEKPPVEPAAIRTRPPNGFILRPGVGTLPGTDVVPSGAGAIASSVTSGAGKALRIQLPAQVPGSGNESSVLLRPTVGRWDLRDSLEVRAVVRNDGDLPVTPRIRLESNGGSTGWFSAPAPLAKGKSTVIIAPFAAPTPAVWSVSGENYWDKTSHWSRKDVILGGGVVRLRYEKKYGFNNDDPKQKATEYAAGYLHTYGKWTQRYGYFEARMKLPTAPGLWPAFWMMPDRGPADGPQWKRQDTGNGGMEFDIMEHLTRWGPHRYNIAMHYDGYGADHKSIGSDRIYVEPDKDGFITCGLLWAPGSAVYYCNGKEVLRWENPRISSVPSILMFTLPMGGWDNDSLDDSRLPADFVIDYVRVWQRKDLLAVPMKDAPPA